MKPVACVIGDLSLVRALGRYEIPVVVVVSGNDDSSVQYSRYCEEIVRVPSFVEDPMGAVRALCDWGRQQANKPVLYYQGDSDLLALSRGRDELSRYFELMMPEARLVEDLVDKVRFAELAERVSLPVPPTLVLRRGHIDHAALRAWTHFPCVLKPSTRTRWFGSNLQTEAVGTNQKAVRIEQKSELDRLLPYIDGHATDFILQAAVEGGEECILSYHAYVREGGEIVGDFTGKKVRTSPMLYGLSTCVEISDDAEVRRLGRLVLERLKFSGVVKIDFKKDARDGRLSLLEVNPRYNLWHHPGAVAGVNIPAMVYRDTMQPGAAKAPPRGARAGVRWMSSRHDLAALREYRAAGKLGIAKWISQVVTSDVIEDMSFLDPLPGLVDLLGTVRRKLVTPFGKLPASWRAAKG